MSEQHLTARVPELPAVTESLSLFDKLIIWIAATNKTSQVEIGTIMQFFALGGSVGGGGVTPPNSADKGRYTFEATQAQIDQGSDKLTIYLPQFAGKNFTLRMDFRDLLDSEYEVLNAGGFHLTIPGVEEIIAGTRFTLDFAEKIATGGDPVASGGALFSGKLVVNVNKTMTTADIGKIIQFRAGSTRVSVTLPDMLQVPLYTPFIIEAATGNTKQNIVQTQADQYIYMENEQYSKLYVGPGQSLWMYRDSDGYFVFNDFAKHYKDIGIPYARWKVEAGELMLDGTEYLRADYPLLWEYAQTLASQGSLVSDAVWNTPAAVTPNNQLTERPYRGKWSTGNGTTTFRVPDFMNMTIRGLKSAADNERVDSAPGNYQKHMLELHTHPFDLPRDNGAGSLDVQSINDTPGSDEGYAPAGNTGGAGGAETRMDNIGMYWVVKY